MTNRRALDGDGDGRAVPAPVPSVPEQSVTTPPNGVNVQVAETTPGSTDQVMEALSQRANRTRERMVGGGTVRPELFDADGAECFSDSDATQESARRRHRRKPRARSASAPRMSYRRIMRRLRASRMTTSQKIRRHRSRLASERCVSDKVARV
jgi:hypothetical protein